MAYTITTQTIAAQPIAAVRRRVRGPQLAEVWPAALDQIRTFLRSQRDLTPGRNVFLFHYPERSDDPLDVDIGIEVSKPFKNQGEITCINAPAGEVATTIHRGAHATLMDAHAALFNWCVNNRRNHGPVSWYAYRDGGDPTAMETQVYYLLR